MSNWEPGVLIIHTTDEVFGKKCVDSLRRRRTISVRVLGKLLKFYVNEVEHTPHKRPPIKIKLSQVFPA